MVVMRTAVISEPFCAAIGEVGLPSPHCGGIRVRHDLATQLTKERGRLVIAGYHQGELRRVDMQLWNWRGPDVINAHERNPRLYLRGMKAALDFVLKAALDPMPLYTHIFPLEELGSALETTRRRTEGMLKALVLP